MSFPTLQSQRNKNNYILKQEIRKPVGEGGGGGWEGGESRGVKDLPKSKQSEGINSIKTHQLQLIYSTEGNKQQQNTSTSVKLFNQTEQPASKHINLS